MSDKNKEDDKASPVDIKPAPRRAPIHGRAIAHDGLDNSDLRMLLDLAAKEASREK
jgi:hypothetical protein